MLLDFVYSSNDPAIVTDMDQPFECQVSNLFHSPPSVRDDPSLPRPHLHLHIL